MLIIARHRALSTRPAQAAAHTRAPPPADRGRRSPHCSSTLTGHLKMSLTFSPACLALPAAWSLWPSASRSRSSVALPAASLPFPASSWALFCSLSVPLMGNPSSVVVGEALPRWWGGHTRDGVRWSPSPATGPSSRKACGRSFPTVTSFPCVPAVPEDRSQVDDGRGLLSAACLGSGRRNLSDSVLTAV